MMFSILSLTCWLSKLLLLGGLVVMVQLLIIDGICVIVLCVVDIFIPVWLNRCTLLVYISVLVGWVGVAPHGVVV